MFRHCSPQIMTCFLALFMHHHSQTLKRNNVHFQCTYEHVTIAENFSRPPPVALVATELYPRYFSPYLLCSYSALALYQPSQPVPRLLYLHRQYNKLPPAPTHIPSKHRRPPCVASATASTSQRSVRWHDDIFASTVPHARFPPTTNHPTMLPPSLPSVLSRYSCPPPPEGGGRARTTTDSSPFLSTLSRPPPRDLLSQPSHTHTHTHSHTQPPHNPPAPHANIPLPE